MTINSICTHLNQVWMESGVSEDALSGHIQLMLPGRTACFQCLPPLAVASGLDEKTIRRDGVCAASLPTTIGIIAGLLSHNALKYLLAFGQISYYQGFMSQTNFFPSTILYPNPECPNPDCHRLQQVFRRKWKPEEWKPVIIPVSEDENEWGITYPMFSLHYRIPLRYHRRKWFYRKMQSDPEPEFTESISGRFDG